MGAGKTRVGYRQHYPVRELRFPLASDEPDPGVRTDTVGASFDGLWKAARPLIASGFVRDRMRVTWRFSERPDRSYRMVYDGDTWGVLALRDHDALVVDYLARDVRPDTFETLWRNLRGEAARMGARTLVFWEPPDGPWRSLLLGRTGLPGATVADMGYSWATAVLFDEDVLAKFLEGFHFTPACYDDR
jgi:hypothetical protein